MIYYQIPESLLYQNIDYNFDNNNDLIVQTDHVFKVKANKEVQFYLGEGAHRFGTEMFESKENRLFVHEVATGIFYEITENGPQKSTRFKKNMYCSFFELGNNLLAYDQQEALLYKINFISYGLNPSGNRNFFSNI